LFFTASANWRYQHWGKAFSYNMQNYQLSVLLPKTITFHVPPFQSQRFFDFDNIFCSSDASELDTDKAFLKSADVYCEKFVVYFFEVFVL
jgi:hypothetical protein